MYKVEGATSLCIACIATDLVMCLNFSEIPFTNSYITRVLWSDYIHIRNCWGPLLGATWPLYNQGESWVHTFNTKSNTLPHGVGLCQVHLLSLILFVIFMDRIWRRSRSEEFVQYRNLRNVSLLFADDVVQLAYSALWEMFSKIYWAWPF